MGEAGGASFCVIPWYLRSSSKYLRIQSYLKENATRLHCNDQVVNDVQ
jgi:hypothetical protein